MTEWLTVPREPTEAMIDSGVVASEHQSVSRIYRAMISASPPPPVRAVTVEEIMARVIQANPAIDVAARAVMALIEGREP
jgi:hypothetical protein